MNEMKDLSYNLSHYGNLRTVTILDKEYEFTRTTDGIMSKNPKFYPENYTEEQINIQVLKSISRFKKVNEVMVDNERYPLFSVPEDTYNSAIEYVDLLKKKTKL